MPRGASSVRERLLSAAALSVLLVRAAWPATFVVNDTADVPDAAPGDGVCATAPGDGVCTLRAAILEANALPGADTVMVPAGTCPAGGSCGGVPCWKATTGGFRFADRSFPPGGSLLVRLDGGGPKDATLSVRRRRGSIGQPDLPLTTPVAVRLLRTDAPACFESRFGQATERRGAIQSHLGVTARALTERRGCG